MSMLKFVNKIGSLCLSCIHIRLCPVPHS